MPTPTDLRQVILDIVAEIPKGSVTTYGTVATAARLVTGKGSARYVGQVLSRQGDQVPWWRVVNASGQCVPHLADLQRRLLEAEGHTFSSGTETKLDITEDWYDPTLED